MEREGLGQAELAAKAGVSQSTVSRALSGSAAKRESKTRRKLLVYAGIFNSAEGARAKVIAAFDEMWDGSESQADTVASIIRGLADLLSGAKERGEER
jgi:transcriptional regulator with XRE-family HTH domain